MDLDAWQEILNSIKNNKLRTFLTGLSVALGIYILVILLGLGNGLQNGVLSKFGKRNINTFYIWGSITDLPYKGLPKGRRITLNMDDYAQLKKMSDIKLISARYFGGNMKLTAGGETGSYSTNGCHPDLMQIENYIINQGRWINDNDIISKRKVLVIGSTIKNELFKRNNPIGSYVTLSGVAFQIIGIYEEDGSTRSANLFIPITTMQLIFAGGSNEIHNFSLTTIPVKSEIENKIVEANIRNLIAMNHQFDPNDTKAVGSYGAFEDFNNVNMMFVGIGIFIWIIGIGTLIAGIVGVSNVMLIMVKERTKEIGVRRALGATPMNIIRMILLEAIFITSMFGYIGMILGVGCLQLFNFALKHQMIDNEFIVNPSIDLSTAISATILLVISGGLAGYFPAKKAVKQKPIDAIRTE